MAGNRAAGAFEVFCGAELAVTLQAYVFPITLLRQAMRLAGAANRLDGPRGDDRAATARQETGRLRKASPPRSPTWLAVSLDSVTLYPYSSYDSKMSESAKPPPHRNCMVCVVVNNIVTKDTRS